LSEYEKPEAVNKYFPGGWHLSDAEERPLLILRLGQMDVKGIIKVIELKCLAFKGFVSMVEVAA
jgi:hypothetical protein